MWIEKIELKNFGKFQDKQITFSKGLNVIYGANEAGKTTIHSFLLGMLFGMEKSRGRRKEDAYDAYEPWNSASYYIGSMQMRITEKPFLLERNFYHKEKSARLMNLEDKEELSVEFGDLQMLLGGMTKENYQNTYCIKQAGFLADATLADALESYMADVSNSGGGSVRIRKAQTELMRRKKEAEKTKRQLGLEREERVKKLSMEVEFLRQDIAFQKNSDLAEVIARQEAAAAKQEVRVQQARQVTQQKRLWGVGILGALVVAGILGIVLKGFWWLGGISVFLMPLVLLWMRKGTKEVQKNIVVEELAEGLEQMKEQWKDKENRCHNMEEQIAELMEPSKEELKLEEDSRAYTFAIEEMDRIAGQIYEEISDRLHEAVSKNLSRITHGKYDSILLDEKLHLAILENGRKVPVGRLSRGTLEQAYLAMRLAVGSILMQEEPMPVLLDEIFGMYDDSRLQDTLEWLASYPGQSIIFSCQKRELDMLDKLAVPYKKIELN